MLLSSVVAPPGELAISPGAPAARRQRSLPAMVGRVAQRTLVRSVYLLTAPVTALFGIVVMLIAVSGWAIGSAVPHGTRVARRALMVARRSGDIEWWRVRAVRARSGETVTGARRPLHPESAGPGVWLDLAHAVALLPVVLLTWSLTVMWWWVGLATATSPLRTNGSGPLTPLTLYIGDADSHAAVQLGLTTPAGRHAFALAIAVLALATLPLVTRLCFAVQAGLARELLSTDSALHRWMAGVEQERDTARASAAAAVSAEADALRRLERDIHDGPQQNLVRLAMELGRAQHHFDSRPELVRAALAEALDQTHDILEELRALSRGIAPPLLADRGLPAALMALADRSIVPVELDLGPVIRPLSPGAETAVYFVVAEALANVAKHSRASRCTVQLRDTDGRLHVSITDDGAGGAALVKGHGLQGLSDRAFAVGGRLQVDSPHGGPTTITAEVPWR